LNQFILYSDYYILLEVLVCFSFLKPDSNKKFKAPQNGALKGCFSPNIFAFY